MYKIGGRMETWEERRSHSGVRKHACEIAGRATNFADRVLSLRQFAGLYQRDVRDVLRLPQDRMTKFEQGHAEPTEAEYEALAAFFGIPVDQLRGAG